MKTRLIIMALLIGCFSTSINAQFLKKLGKAATDAAAKTLEKKVENKSSKETDKAFDSVFNKKKKKKKLPKLDPNTNPNTPNSPNSNFPNPDNSSNSETYDISTKTDFRAGNIVIFSDRFENDVIGDFPVNWDTNGSGDIGIINEEKWMKTHNNSTYVPILSEELPENYSVEFDLFLVGFTKKTTSAAYLNFVFDDISSVNTGKNRAVISISPVQYIAPRTIIEKYEKGTRTIRNTLVNDYRAALKGKSRISIMVNKQRLRIWLNEEKIIDIPRMFSKIAVTNFKFNTNNIKNGNGENLYVSNFKIAKTGEDSRSKLLTEGRLSTNAILFETGKATLKDSSYTIIGEIAKVLQENPEVKINIIGHTDAQGSEASNLELSKKRAIAVKKAMTANYYINPTRISTDGMGERSPVASNSSTEGKALNRRVEFIKL